MLPIQTFASEDFHPNWFRNLLFGFLILVAVLQILMIFRFEVNWDEFFLLDWVYKWNRGEMDLVLQTIYFRAFSWVPRVSENEVTQIVAARGVMLACLSITCGFIYSLCRKFTNVSNAVLSLILFLTMTFVFRNATSFRNDMLVVTVLMGVLWLLMTPVLSWKRILASGLFLGLAGAITIKAIFYTPIVAVILFAHWGNSKWQMPIFLKSCALAVCAIVSFVALYFLHSLSINVPTASADYLSHSISGSLLEAGLFPTRRTLQFAVLTNPFFFVLLLLGIICTVLNFRKPNERWAYIAAASFVFPLLTIIFYRHAHPYFYTFMLAPTTVLIAIGLNTPLLKKSTFVTFGLTIALLVNTASISRKSFSQNLDVQKQVLTIVHKLFPTATAYIDRCAMISSYPKSGLFMSQWMMNNYRNANETIMEDILTKEQPKFILANIDGLDLDNIKANADSRLLKEDEKLLQENYISHWGPLYVAGKTLSAIANIPQEFQIYIEGPYGIESAGPVKIDGVTYKPGDLVALKQGYHILTSSEPQNISFRWNKLTIPDEAPPTQKLFFGFFPVKVTKSYNHK